MLGQMKWFAILLTHLILRTNTNVFSSFIFAGFETTATAVTRLLTILAEKPNVQARLRTEIRNAKRKQLLTHKDDAWNDVELSYDDLMSLPYLDAIIRETLRVHPPSSLFGRTWVHTLLQS